MDSLDWLKDREMMDWELACKELLSEELLSEGHRDLQFKDDKMEKR